MDADVRWQHLAAELARMPGVAERLLAVHAEDGSGRCAVCSSGRQTARYVWPCQLHLLATRAIEVRDAGEPPDVTVLVVRPTATPGRRR
jgi:hypothetical protein